MNNNYLIDEDIVHLASPIKLNVKETNIELNDYFVDPSQIDSVCCIYNGLITTYQKEKNLVHIDIQNAKVLPAIMQMYVKMYSGKEYCLILKKSQKILKKIIYRPWSQVNSVQIAGDFNSWNPNGYNFIYNNANNCWEFDLLIEPGTYSYQLIADGNWFCDPNNPNKIDNGYGQFNSVLSVINPDEFHESKLFIEKIIENVIIISGNNQIGKFIALWQNTELTENYRFRNNDKLMLSIPNEANDKYRSFIRIWAYNESGISNDLLIPLEYGKVITDAKQLCRNDKEAQIMYFTLVDRFAKGNNENYHPVNEEGLHPKLNFHGGDICGILKKLKEGYFQNLGINTIWISPLCQNPETVCVKDGKKSSGYHGYWPVDSKKIDYRFGKEEDLIELVELAHKQKINVILDFVSNHVHENNTIIKEHPDWCTPLYLPDGSKNIGRWEDQRFTTWFDEFLPTLDYDNPQVVETITDIALYWIEKYDLDGFRHDATKHIPNVYWKALTKKLKERIMKPKSKRLYQIGETFGGRDMLMDYINSGMLDGQFSFNLYYCSRAAFSKDDEPFNNLATALLQDLKCFGYNHMMGNITGNHDLPRFISYAGEDLGYNQNAEYEGWVRSIQVKNPNGYKKLSALTAFICTIPGIPVIYYGDEIGMAGGGDPDNRRPMKFDGLNEHEIETRNIASKIIKIRQNSLSLIYGDINFVLVTPKDFVYFRSYLDETTIMVFHKSNETQTLTIDLPHRCGNKHYYSNFGNVFMISDTQLSITMKPYSFDILTSKLICQ